MPTLHPSHVLTQRTAEKSAHPPRPPCPSLSFSPHAQPKPSSAHSPRPPFYSHVPTQPTAEAKLGITINDGPPKPKRTAYRPEEEQRLGTPTLIVVDVAENGRRAGARVGMVVVAVNGQALYEPALCSIKNHDDFSRYVAVECSDRPLELTMEEPVVPGSDTDVTAERVRGWEAWWRSRWPRLTTTPGGWRSGLPPPHHRVPTDEAERAVPAGKGRLLVWEERWSCPKSHERRRHARDLVPARERRIVSPLPRANLPAALVNLTCTLRKYILQPLTRVTETHSHTSGVPPKLVIISSPWSAALALNSNCLPSPDSGVSSAAACSNAAMYAWALA